MNDKLTTFTTFESPFGTMVIASKSGKIFSVRVVSGDDRWTPRLSWTRADDELAEARDQMAAYFAGQLREFSLPLELTGTPFQRHAWRILRAVPYGTTITYGAMAHAMGRPGASRAVGRAMNQNPISVVVPCHRVLGAGGALTGYLNGIDMKRGLLDMEGANQMSQLTLAGIL